MSCFLEPERWPGWFLAIQAQLSSSPALVSMGVILPSVPSSVLHCAGAVLLSRRATIK